MTTKSLQSLVGDCLKS